ncbi:DUF6961 family protein [Sphingopyxis panaciterrae]
MFRAQSNGDNWPNGFPRFSGPKRMAVVAVILGATTGLAKPAQRANVMAKRMRMRGPHQFRYASVIGAGVNLRYSSGGGPRLDCASHIWSESHMIGGGEVWERALAVERVHGDKSAQFVSDRIATCRRKGHTDAASLWENVENLLREIQQIHRPLKKVS